MYEIGRKIATFRKERKMSQTDLANALGITKQLLNMKLRRIQFLLIHFPISLIFLISP